MRADVFVVGEVQLIVVGVVVTRSSGEADEHQHQLEAHSVNCTEGFDGMLIGRHQRHGHRKLKSYDKD
uniref:Secreted protein n=1 Tax=Angiostrongylus cantonensis TaxID=6313 RepID=A0A0K0DBA2_ANGCA